ncbi:MAG: hypothetical protein FWF29_05315, partial [Treponema sp.]|nr:hypothetical protein [Treponema sp.]
MSFISTKFKAPFILASLIFLFPLVFSACSNDIGFGKSIDFEPPVLTLDSIPNPWYVSGEAVLSGTVTDNVAVDRVICRDAVNNDTIYGKAVITGTKWTITLQFTEADNTKKISTQIVAWDKAGNSGEQSIQYATFIVDTRPPMFQEPYIQRSLSRSAPLQSLEALRNLENSDPDGSNIQNVELYQNGTFWIEAEVIENETYAQTVELHLYDYRYDSEGNEVYSANFDNTNPFSPEWTIKESVLAAAGDAKGWGYSDTLNNGGRIYLRLTLVAKDLADNEGVFDDKTEDFGYLCLYRDADIPKISLAGGIGQFIPPGTGIPVDIFDDDTLSAAYIDLLTKQQFEALGADDAARMAALEAKFIKGDTVANWKAAVPGYTASDGIEFTNRITSANLESTTVTVNTGQNTSDCGEFVLVAFVKDQKGLPHIASDPSTMPDPAWNQAFYSFSVIDDKAALIVLDTVNTTASDYDPAAHQDGDDSLGAYASTGDSPEESTFPRLINGQYFYINGYTLNADSASNSGVVKFRIAWIPYYWFDNIAAVPGLTDKTPDGLLQLVQNALKADTGYPDGVQHWELPVSPDPPATDSYFVKGSPLTISNTTYTKQVFKKKFFILKDSADDLKPAEYDNFTRIKGDDSTFENSDKYFVLYALNSNGNDTFRTIRLLGNTNPPLLSVYDLTNVQDVPLNNMTGNESPLANYTAIRNWVSGKTDGFKNMDNLAPYLADPFTVYPVGSVYKAYAMADAKDGVAIQSLDMFDASDGTDRPDGWVNLVNEDIAFVKPISTVSLNVFKFNTENKLDISNYVQRTISITNSARLTAIITPLSSGTYGAYDGAARRSILLRAQFSSAVMVRPPQAGSNVPVLNIRYETNPNQWVYTSVSWDPAGVYNNPYVYLNFPWQVPFDANGRLETVDQSNSYNSDYDKNLHPGYNPATDLGNVNNETHSIAPGQSAYQSMFDRPINLNNTQIVDSDREANVFLPGAGETGYPLTWNDNTGNLQGGTTGDARDGKNITLDGIIPVINDFIVGDNDPYTGSATWTNKEKRDAWYFYNTDDIITFRISANKPIRANGNPTIQFQIRYPTAANPLDGGALRPGTFTAQYQRPDDSMGSFGGLLFTINASEIQVGGGGNPNCGVIEALSLLTDANNNIVDGVGNLLDPDSVGAQFTALNAALVVDNTVPSIPAPLLGGGPKSEAAAVPRDAYNYNPTLSMNNVDTNVDEPWGAYTEYSLDGGLNWAAYPDVRSDWTSNASGNLTVNTGQWTLVARQVDTAGNESDLSPAYAFDIENEFPQLLSIYTKQPKGYYTGGDSLDFVLDFDRPVITTNTSAYIIVSDWNTNTTDTSGNKAIVVNVTAQPKLAAPQVNNKTSLTFTWPIAAATKIMDTGIT